MSHRLKSAINWWEAMSWTACLEVVTATAGLTGVENPQEFMSRNIIDKNEVLAIYDAARTIS